MAAPALAAARPSATISSTVMGIPGCLSRPHGPFSATSIQTLLKGSHLLRKSGQIDALQLVLCDLDGRPMNRNAAA